MKKITAIAAVILATLCLASCSAHPRGTDNSKKSDVSSVSENGSEKKDVSVPSTTISEEKAEHLAKKIENGRFDSFDSYNEEEKAKIKKQVEKDGYTLEYNEDGSGTLSNEEGSWFVGKGWTENEYTKGVPPIDFGMITMSSEMDENGEKFNIFLIKDASVLDAQSYVEKIKSAGFAEVGENESNVDAGVVTYIGKNSAGKQVEIAYSSYGFTVKIIL